MSFPLKEQYLHLGVINSNINFPITTCTVLRTVGVGSLEGRESVWVLYSEYWEGFPAFRVHRDFPATGDWRLIKFLNPFHYDSLGLVRKKLSISIITVQYSSTVLLEYSSTPQIF
jgi:hypothetical protein